MVQPLARAHAIQVPSSFPLLAASRPGQPLPPAVQAKMENVFGTSLADVRIHVGPQASSIGALAFTTGSDIYFAPGQYDPHSGHGQRLLGHELAHVVQQKAGRVPHPFVQGIAIVQNPGLEAEAERMSLRVATRPQPPVPPSPARAPLPPIAGRPAAPHVQASLQMKRVLPQPTTILVRPPTRPAPPPLPTLRAARPPVVAQPAEDKRPGFTSNSKQSAFLFHNLLSGHDFQVNLRRPGLPSFNAAMPHRMSWKDIRDNTNKFYDGEDSEDDFERWTDRFIRAGEDKIRQTKRAIRRSDDDDEIEGLEKLQARQERSQDDFTEARDALIRRQRTKEKKEFLRQANSFHANVPDLGPHFGVNNPVSEYAHLHFLERSSRDRSRSRSRGRDRKRKRSLSPMSKRVVDMSPERLSGIATTADDDIITVTGATVRPKGLSRDLRRRLSRHRTKVIKSYDEDFDFGS